MNIMSLYEFRSEQTVSGSRRYRIYLNDKLNFCHHIIERNTQMHIRSENLFY